MRLSLSAIAIAALIAPSSANNLDCKNIKAQGQRFDFSKLGGPKWVSSVHDVYPQRLNTTFYVDICKPLRKNEKERKNCRAGSYICGVESIYSYGKLVTPNANTINIAGQYPLSHGATLDPKWTRLRGSDASNDESEKEGVRLALNGPEEGGRKQEAIIEFSCPTGDSPKLQAREDMLDALEEDGGGGGGSSEKEKEEWEKLKRTDDGDGGTLEFLSYGPIEKEKKDVLRLNWYTKRACEDAEVDEPSESGGGMGFFGWVFTLLILGTAAYFIFFAWVNYNRYGARGWDLVPHSDAIRDLPYVLGDWFRKVVSTIQGGGSRGGYTAV